MLESKLAHTFKKWATIEPFLTYRKTNLSYILVLKSLIENSTKELKKVTLSKKQIQWHRVAHVKFISLKETFLRLWKVKHLGQRTEHAHSFPVFWKTYLSQMHPLYLSVLICLTDPVPWNSVLKGFGSYELHKTPLVAPWKGSYLRWE